MSKSRVLSRPLRWTPWVLALAVALQTGCAMRRVPAELLEKLPYDAKVELLESENDLAVAVDRLDDVSSELVRGREQLRRSRSRLDAAKTEVSRASDELSREVAQLAVVEAERRVEWLRARQWVAAREEQLATQGLECAQARYEQSKLGIVRKAKLEGIEKLDPAAFDAQVARCDERLASLKERLKETGAEAEAKRAAWDEARALLAKKTFDARASPFVE